MLKTNINNKNKWFNLKTKKMLRQYTVKHYSGLSTEKPDTLPFGDFFFEEDTGQLYKYGQDGLAKAISISSDAFKIRGNWNAATNTPELLDNNGQTGDFYIVSVDGDTPLIGPNGVVYSDHKKNQEIYKTVDGFWEVIPDSRNVYDGDSEDTQTKGDLRVAGDIHVDGEVFNQQDSSVYKNVKIGSTGNKLVITDIDNGKQSLIAKNEITGGVSLGTKDVFRYDSFSKTDVLGLGQVDESLTFTSSEFTEYLTGETKYCLSTTLTSANQLVTDVWYLRSLTGFVNSYIYVYQGDVDFATLSDNQDSYYWSTNTKKQIRNKNGLLNKTGGVGVDLEYKLGNTFFEKAGDVYTYVFVADNEFTIQGQTFDGIDAPFVLGQGSRWGEVNTSSEVIVSGNLSLNEFNGNLQINNNNTEYYGCDTILKAGIYNTVEVPYKNRNVSSGNGNIFVFILDQDNVTISYKKWLVGNNGPSDGVLEIVFESDFLIETSGIYQVVIGRSGWSNSKSIELFHKDINSSDGSVWAAYSSSNSSLNTGDPSGVDWSTINKQNFNRIPKSLIYKF